MKISSYRKFLQNTSAPALMIVLMIFFPACNLTRTVGEDEKLLNGVKIKIKNDNLRSELNTFAKQHANRKIFWAYRFRLRFYNSFLFKKNSTAGLRTVLGEPPVIYDSTISSNSVIQMKAFLKNKGYYDNNVRFEEKINWWNKKKLDLTYLVYLGTPTTIAGLNYDIADTAILVAIASSQPQTLIKPKENFDIDVLEKERSRIARYMQNRGYFFFTSDLVTYYADTVRVKKKAVILIKVKENPVKYFNDSIKVDPYKEYQIENIYIKQDFDNLHKAVAIRDTVTESGYQYINRKSLTVKPKVISRSIFLKPESRYILEDHENTYRRITSLNTYKYVNMSYVKTPDDTISHLDCFISLSPSDRRSFGFEFNLTSTGGNPGIYGSLSAQNRNTFGGAELFKWRMLGGLEAQNVKAVQGEVVNNTPFNTIELGPELSLTLPKFLFPIDHNRFSKRVIPHTIITVSYNYQQRPDYTRNITNANLGYSWRESKTKTHTIQPINLSQVQIQKSDTFQRRLDAINNSSLAASYEDNFITSVVYNFVYNNQVLQKRSGYSIFRGNLELAGTVASFIDRNILKTAPDENGQFLINNIPYAQFARSYFEFIRNIGINSSTSFVSRTFMGVGIPYGNSRTMPFVKRFYGGGTTGVRAWKSRSLGPGSISNEILKEQSIDQIGDIKLEQNLELRFKIIRFLEGAFFTDVGNIWILESKSTNSSGYGQNAYFDYRYIWRDLAVGMGAGARLNFNYFVVRLDVAKRAKDPGASDPYAFKLFYSNPATFNFAIGYPF